MDAYRVRVIVGRELNGNVQGRVERVDRLEGDLRVISGEASWVISYRGSQWVGYCYNDRITDQLRGRVIVAF